jgi:hypothetical protein
MCVYCLPYPFSSCPGLINVDSQLTVPSGPGKRDTPARHFWGGGGVRRDFLFLVGVGRVRFRELAELHAADTQEGSHRSRIGMHVHWMRRASNDHRDQSHQTGRESGRLQMRAPALRGAFEKLRRSLNFQR